MSAILKFNFELKNLRLVGEDDPSSTAWSIELQPGDQLTKKIEVVEGGKGYGHKLSCSVALTELVGSEEAAFTASP